MLSLGATRRFVRGAHSSGRRPNECRCECRCECRLAPVGDHVQGFLGRPGRIGLLLRRFSRSRGPVRDTHGSERGKGAPIGAPRRPIWRPIWRPRRTRPQGSPCDRSSSAATGMLTTRCSRTLNPRRQARRLRRGRRTRHRTHATLPDWKTSPYGREMRRPWTTRCLRPGLRARLTLSAGPQDDLLDAGPVGPLVAGGRRCRLGPGYAPPRGPHRAPTHPSPTDRRRAATRAAAREQDLCPGTPCMPTRNEPGA